MKSFFGTALLLFSLTYWSASGQNISPHQKVIKLSLHNGNQILGSIISEKTDSLRIHDFQLGKLSVAYTDIHDSDLIKTNNHVQLELNDLRIFAGTLQKISEDSLTIRDEKLGLLNVPFSAIRDIKTIKPGLPGAWTNDPNNTRYFFAPSAFILRKGDGYYQNAYILSNSVSYGVNDHFTIGGGIILPIIFYITPKVGFSPGDYVHLSAGIIAGGTYLNKGIMAGIGYGLVTLGTRDYHLSIGAGYGAYYGEQKWQQTKKPILNVSGTARLNKRFSLVSENWIFQAAFDETIQTTVIVDGMEQIIYENVPGKGQPVAACSAGGRFVWKKIALDLGVIAPVNFPDMNFVVPYIDLVVKF